MLYLLFALIFFLRMWMVPELFNFTFSEEMQAHMAWEQIKNFHPIWIGVSAANINFYLGPGMTYLNAFLFFLSKGDPIILGYFATLLGFTTSVAMYMIVKDLYSKKVALFATAIYGVSMLINLHDRRFWNPSPIPLITLLMVYSLIKAKKNTNWYILTAILFGAALHTHLTLLLFAIPALYSLYTNWRNVKLKTWALMVASYLLVVSPLIVFDFVHNFDNLLMPIRTLTGKQHAALDTFTPGHILNHLRDLLSALGRLWFIKFGTNPQDEIVLESHQDKTPGNVMLSVLSLVALGWYVMKNREPGYKIFFLSLATILTAFLLYPSYNPEYYLMSFLTLMCVVIGNWLAAIPQDISLRIIALFIIINIATTVTLSDKYGLMTRKRLVKKTMTVIGQKSFDLETYGELPSKQFAYAGWRYLFKTYGKTPLQSNVDQVLWWVYPDEMTTKKTELHVVVSDTVLPKLERKPIAVLTEGPYTSFVFKNE